MTTYRKINKEPFIPKLRAAIKLQLMPKEKAKAL